MDHHVYILKTLNNLRARSIIKVNDSPKIFKREELNQGTLVSKDL